MDKDSRSLVATAGISFARRLIRLKLMLSKVLPLTQRPYRPKVSRDDTNISFELLTLLRP
jgi:hypothetical protein